MYVFWNPDDPHQQIRTIDPNDPIVPAGWILSGGSDGAMDRDVQAFKAGGASGGYPTYPPIAGQQTAAPDLATLLTNLRTLNGTDSMGFQTTGSAPTVDPTLVWDVGLWDVNTWGP